MVDSNFIQDRVARFKDAPWIEKDGKLTLGISVLGVGGIGSNTLFNLSRAVPANYYIFDMDNVEEHNIATQFFSQGSIGVKKVHSIRDMMVVFRTPSVIHGVIANITDYADWKRFITPITITGFDNMKARKHAFERWKECPERELFIDGRLKATSYEVYAVTPEREEEYEKTLFEDSEIPDDPCTFKQTGFFGMLIGARITNIVTNFLTNKYLEEDICEVPFKFKELGELCYVEVS